VDDEAFVGAFGHRQRDFGQAVGVPAACAGKMRMALVLGAMVGQLVMPRPFVHKDPVHQADLQQARERSVDGYFVEMPRACPAGDLVVAQRFTGFEQNFQYAHSAGRAVEFCSL